MKYISIISLVLITACATQGQSKKDKSSGSYTINKTDAEWKSELSDLEYYILREKGTERPGTGKYDDHDEIGLYVCAACGNPLFNSDTKFDAHCGWPSYFQYATDSSVVELQDNSHGMRRTEIQCARCGGHLGHVFNDGPPPTGLRYCINSVSLDFIKEE
ncbi:peptide-methionine (R)-S-oxide reductase MsrB [Reichenbachiella agariperforans]|uniref:Peptide methionine sulfoxide reductase MsrB n=1 Tax=Reichenbachiella agariperforans TaxID=156994 RepID=A0A1M6THI2_REIAG|nr:peptide-methionine (R)-S-oxide reductase MsrB [Reichenbachiella agariperforans]MBU2915438.1 peptide-methionine (R)-S-oxide reductase MsrB [Reichenbachiella agariperforans]SHK56349.1 peptide-methionine (R)-S-oxide reductase [Reichenbachiella agariperforans]